MLSYRPDSPTVSDVLNPWPGDEPAGDRPTR